MNQPISLRKDTQIFILAAALFFLIGCPLFMIFAKAVITDGRLDLNPAWQTPGEIKMLDYAYGKNGMISEK
ncbi:MAG: hypothetical protein AAGU32_00675 [Bacillota bacterium]